MELKEGFQKTDIGIIPNDWKVKTISEISNPVRGGSPRPAGDPKFFNGNYIPWLTVAALTNIPISQIYVSETENYLTEEGSLYSRILEKDTLIIANSGATLGVAKLLSMKCCANDGIAALLDFDKDINKSYLVYFINTKIKYLREVLATGNGQPNLNTDLIGNIKIPLPPTKAEQTFIAIALSDIDALIVSLEKLITKKRNIKQGAMQKLLQPKEGWEVRKLEEIGKCVRGVSYNAERDLYPYDTNITLRLLRSNNIQNRNFDFNDLQFVDIGRVKTNQMLLGNDIVICMANGSKQLVGKSAVFKIQNKNKYTFGAFMGCFRTDEILANSIFVAVTFQSFQYRSYVGVLLSGSSINNLKPSDIESIEIPFPSLNEQTHIATILSDMDAEITSLETKLAKYRNIKLGMMQELLTGKIRLI